MNREYRLISTYNRMRILTVVEKLLEEKGAKILKGVFDEPIEIKCYTNEDWHKEEIEALPVLKLRHKYLHTKFLLNGFFYEFEFDDNPFFPMHYSKIKVNEDGSYIGQRFGYTSDDKEPDTLTNNMAYDAIFRICDDQAIQDMAEHFVESLADYFANGKENDVVWDEVRVPNVYNNRTHKERKYNNSKCSIFTNDYVAKEEK